MPAYRMNMTVPAHIAETLVRDYDIYDPADPDGDVFAGLRALKQAAPPIFWTRNNGGHWFVTDPALVTRVLQDPVHFSSGKLVVPIENNGEGRGFIPINLDPPEHTRFRRLLTLALSRKKVELLADGVRALTIRLIEDLKPKGSCEFMSEFAFQMPILVFMRLVDINEGHRLSLLETVSEILRPGGSKKDAIGKMAAYMAPIVAARRADPGDDLISWLATQPLDDGSPMSDADLLSMCTLLLIGGLDSVANTLGFFAAYLARHPDACRHLIEQPSMIPAAVEELLRRHPTVTAGTARLCVADIRLGDADIHCGEIVMSPPAMINFDSSLFADPMEVDFARGGPPIGTFGRGAHNCVGAILARSELSIFLQEWLKRIPQFSLAGEGELVFQTGVNVSYKQVPLTWPTG